MRFREPMDEGHSPQKGIEKFQAHGGYACRESKVTEGVLDTGDEDGFGFAQLYRFQVCGRITQYDW